MRAELCRARARARAHAQKHAAHLYQFIVRAGDDSQSDDVCINWVYFVINREHAQAGATVAAAAAAAAAAPRARYGSITVR